MVYSNGIYFLKRIKIVLGKFFVSLTFIFSNLRPIANAARTLLFDYFAATFSDLKKINSLFVQKLLFLISKFLSDYAFAQTVQVSVFPVNEVSYQLLFEPVLKCYPVH